MKITEKKKMLKFFHKKRKEKRKYNNSKMIRIYFLLFPKKEILKNYFQ